MKPPRSGNQIDSANGGRVLIIVGLRRRTVEKPARRQFAYAIAALHPDALAMNVALRANRNKLSAFPQNLQRYRSSA